eukprot:Seg417.17 transcript_id=Seg417.17/GoldUCD/mRNA.D3Y31 product="Zinc finger protein DZIP1L" protein_id=Seg417.17/GoldUCD/D3Y31
MMPVYSPAGANYGTHGDIRHLGQDEKMPQYYQGGGFSFRKRHSKVDWRRLAAVDVDRIAREVDVQTLQDNIAHVAFCDVENELSLREVDVNLIKLFKLAQLLIEYLLHSQEYLQGYISQFESQIKNAVQDQAKLQADIEKKNNAYRGLKKEYQKSKKLIAEYQLMLRAGASGFHKCPFCTKSFLSDDFLKAHIVRRHSDQTQTTNRGTPKSFVNQISVGQTDNNDGLLRELNHITTKLQETESRMIAEREERDRKYEADREIELQNMKEFSRTELASKDVEISDMKKQIQNIHDMFSKELSQLYTEKDVLQTQLDNFAESKGQKTSTLGTLQDISGDDHQEADVAKIKEQLQKEMMGTYQAQLDKIKKASLRREEQMKKTHNEQLEEVTSAVSQYKETLKQNEAEKIELKAKHKEEQALYNDRFLRYEKMLEDQKMSMIKMEEVMNSQRRKLVADEEMATADSLPQEAVFASTPMPRRSLEIQKDTQDADDSMLLYVASNSKNSFRVSRSSSPSTSEWKDSFNFKVCTQEKGQFNKPLYVYYASGSPYWRQYVSSSAAPPRSCYKLDFVFYVSTVQLMGTTRFFVLDAGSGEVVKSMISKSEIYPLWKQKGLSFFAMKGLSSQNLTKSVSFQSTLNESELDSGDDVSVSSYTGTEDAGKNLAAAIARSREGIAEATKAEDTGIEEKKMDVEKSLEESAEEEDDVTYDESDGKLGTLGSTSQWGSTQGSTLLQTGKFFPFPNNPLAVARYNHSKEMLESCREEAIEILNANLERRGIDQDATEMPSDQYSSKMKLHENEVEANIAMRRPNERASRKRIRDEVDALARERLGIAAAESPKTPEKSAKSKFKSAVSKLKNAAKFGKLSPKKKEKTKETDSRPSSFINESFDEPPSPKTPKLNKSDQDIEELKPKSGGQGETSTFKQERESDVNSELFDDVSENSRWDSEVSSDQSPTPPGSSAFLPKVTVSKPGRQIDIPSPPTATSPKPQPRGEKVRGLAASLEASLNARDGIKKPTGSVDLHDTIKSTEGAAFKPSMEDFDDDDDDDDDDDLGLSSLDDEDYKELTRPKKETPGTSYASSSKPSLQKQSSLTRFKADQTAISKFSADDDFDSDSDLGL